MIFTAEYLAAAPRADLEVTYPDGAIFRSRPICDGNGVVIAKVRDAIAWSRPSAAIECSRDFDRIRRSHEEAFANGVASSSWVRP